MRLAPADPDTPHGRALTSLVDALARIDPRLRLRLNSNRRTLVSLRAGRHGEVLSLHHGLLGEQAALADLPRWVARRGRGDFPGLTSGMQAVSERERVREGGLEGGLRSAFADLATLGGPLDLMGLFSHVHGAWFAHLDPPRIAWARASHRRRQTHIRFGCYRRRPAPLITIHPRLDQPWVALRFVEHVLFHELCHHAQACRPLRGEPIHSDRFRAWERRYPHHEQALAWERAFLRCFLDGTAPDASATHSPMTASG